MTPSSMLSRLGLVPLFQFERFALIQSDLPSLEPDERVVAGMLSKADAITEGRFDNTDSNVVSVTCGENGSAAYHPPFVHGSSGYSIGVRILSTVTWENDRICPLPALSEP